MTLPCSTNNTCTSSGRTMVANHPVSLCSFHAQYKQPLIATPHTLSTAPRRCFRRSTIVAAAAEQPKAPGRPGKTPSDIIYDEAYHKGEDPPSRDMPSFRQDVLNFYNEHAYSDEQDEFDGLPEYDDEVVEWVEAMAEAWDPDDLMVPFEGYTPWATISYNTEDPTLKHSVSVEVDATADTCFRLFDDVLNWGEWFNNIHRMGVDPTDNSKVELYCYYQWGDTPPLELFLPLERTAAVKGKQLSVKTMPGYDGFPLDATVRFESLENSKKTRVSLDFEYAMITQLAEFVGMVGVWGDVNELLESNLAAFKSFAEQVDIEHLEAVRKEDRAAYMAGSNPPEAYAPMTPGGPVDPDKAGRGFGAKNGKKKGRKRASREGLPKRR